MSSPFTPLYICPVQRQPHSDSSGHSPDPQTSTQSMDFSFEEIQPWITSDITAPS